MTRKELIARYVAAEAEYARNPTEANQRRANAAYRNVLRAR
jgi:hypothetical protein